MFPIQFSVYTGSFTEKAATSLLKDNLPAAFDILPQHPIEDFQPEYLYLAQMTKYGMHEFDKRPLECHGTTAFLLV